MELANTALAATPQAGNSDQKNPGIINWVGPRDMSNYSINVTPEKKPVLDKRWEQTHSGAVLWNQSMSIPKDIMVLGDTKLSSNFMAMDNMPSAQISNLTQLSNKNSTPSNGMQSLRASANVYITSVYYNWYWVQDVAFSDEVTIYNAGPDVASGRVIIWILEDGYGFAAPFYNLAPGYTTTVTVPFEAISGSSSVGVKPINVEVRVGPDDISTHFIRLSTDGVEVYNNDANHLADPDGGDSLESSELYHPFNNGYTILREAALAGDNSYTPYYTAYFINDYVNRHMHYAEEAEYYYPYVIYSVSDLYMTSHGYIGVCDDYSTLSIAFERALGVPSRYYRIEMNNPQGPVGHGITEIWDGTGWVHSDPTWHVFNNPQVYKQSGYTDVHLWLQSDASDSVYAGDPSGDQFLDPKFDFGIIVDLGEPPAYN
ncbi:transglutaminase-like domain-containing protein [Methanocella conradii]|nr:transglutaminase-like domain-containing protein [Methanocella conradii]